MKSKFFRNATVFFTVLTIFIQYDDCRAQYYEISLGEKVQKSEWIVEGEITESISYEAQGSVFTCHKLNVLNSIFPLESPCNSTLESENYCVYVITRGGATQEVIENWSHALKLVEGERGLFYLANTSRPVLFTDVPSYEAYAGPQGFIHYGLDDDANYHGSEVFYSYSNPESEIIQPIYDILDTTVIKESFVRNEWELWYLLDNVQLNGNKITFDVRLKAAWGNAFKIKDLSLRLKYDTTFFGENLLINGNISSTLDSELSQSGITISSSQLAEDELSINFSNNTPSAGDFIGESHQKLLTVQLTLQDFNFQGIPYFEILTEGGGTTQIIYDDELNEIIPTKTKLITDLGEFSLCGGINNIMPLEVAAGVQEANSLVFDANPYAGIITITGFDFDDLDEANLAANIPNNYRVELASIIGGVIRVTPFVSDYIQWDDEAIRVKVPSIGYRVDGNVLNLNPEWLAAATGRVRVVHPH